MLLFTLIVAVFCWTPIHAYLDDIVDYSNYTLVVALPETSDHLSKLRDLYLHDAEYKVDFSGIPTVIRKEVVIGVPNYALPALLEQLSIHEIPVIEQRTNLHEIIQKEQEDNPSFIQGRATTFPFDQYNRYEDIQAYLKNLARERSDLVSVQLYGHTLENREINGVRIGKGADKPVILIDAGIHAREWIAPATALYLINQLVTKYGKDADITSLVDKYEWIILPSMNPDGYVYTWRFNRGWRKNRSRPAPFTGCYGVDPNRNFAVGFGGASTSDNPCSDLYPGPNAFSESEARALQKVTNDNAARIRIALTLHAFGQMWMSPWGYTRQMPKDYDKMMTAAAIAVKSLAAVHGTRFVYGPINQVIYPTGGGSSDWQYSVTKTPYVYALELRPTQQGSMAGFELPRTQIIPAAEETSAAIFSLAKYVSQN